MTVTERVTERVTEKEGQLLVAIEQLPSGTYAQYTELLQISRKSVAERIRGLKQKNVIERIGSDTKGYWKIPK